MKPLSLEKPMFEVWSEGECVFVSHRKSTAVAHYNRLTRHKPFNNHSLFYVEPKETAICTHVI